MTRINAGIEPIELVDKHLLAELREIKRIPNCIKSGRYSLDGIPSKFKLGSGHVKFFYNKLKYLLNRYNVLRIEAIKRGFNVQDFSSAWDGCPKELFNDWKPSDEDRNIVESRIKQRLSVMNVN